MTPEQKKYYLEGEMNAVKAVGQAITEAVDALSPALVKLTEAERLFVLLEFKGVMIRSSMLIKEKNKALGCENI